MCQNGGLLGEPCWLPGSTPGTGGLFPSPSTDPSQEVGEGRHSSWGPHHLSSPFLVGASHSGISMGTENAQLPVGKLPSKLSLSSRLESDSFPCPHLSSVGTHMPWKDDSKLLQDF